MFRHIVLYKLKNKGDASAMKERFLSMPKNIPQIVTVETGIDSLCTERSFDISLSVTFNSKEDYLVYKDHPYHLSYVVPFVHSAVEKAVSVDFEA